MNGMSKPSGLWELMLLDPDPPLEMTGSLTVGDIDGDGNVEVLIGGNDLLWYRPATFERGKAVTGPIQCGLDLADIDGDGRLEAVMGLTADPAAREGGWHGDYPCKVSCFKPGSDLSAPWKEWVIDPLIEGNPHDTIAADLDGDGVIEVIATAVYCDHPKLFIYKQSGDPARPWQKHTVSDGFFADGTAAGDLDADGMMEIISGPYLYHAPPAGAFAGPWERTNLAAGFREMCRAALVDITGTGRPDVVICEAEFLEGRIAWFENRMLEDPENPAENILGGIRYLAYLLKTFKDYKDQIHLTFAAYNAGPTRVINEWIPSWGASWDKIYTGLKEEKKSYRETREYSVLSTQLMNLFASGRWVEKKDNFWVNYRDNILAESKDDFYSSIF